MPTIAWGVTNTVRASAADDARSRCIRAWSTPNCDFVRPVWRSSRSSSLADLALGQLDEPGEPAEFGR